MNAWERALIFFNTGRICTTRKTIMHLCKSMLHARMLTEIIPLLPLPFPDSLSWPLAVVGKLIPVPEAQFSNAVRTCFEKFKKTESEASQRR